MIILIEGARNSGKTFLVDKLENASKYKFPFPYWFDELNLQNDSRECHNFGLSKEILFHELNRDGFLKHVCLDRGIFTVLVWGVMEERISLDEALNQLKLFINEGLFRNVKVIYVTGINPTKRGVKDFWSDENYENEAKLYEFFFSALSKDPMGKNFEINRVHNNFDLESIERFKETYYNKCAE